ncbi:MAG: hypothetical protein AAGE59_34425 [Cyanobacteria bacterium P01_F01_bin.86]
MDAIRSDDEITAKRLLRTLKEPNETHLGLSRGQSRGRALGNESAADVYTALSNSEAANSGMLEDLEDTILLVDGISSDIISDITTNIVRQPLIRYTQAACNWYRILLTNDVDSGPMWDPNSRSWFSDFVSLPVVESGKLLLVPKSIVRRRMDYDADEYYRHYILEHLKEVELSANSELVYLLKDGTPKVTKKSPEEKYGRGKHVNIEETKKEPSVLSRYRNAKSTNIRPPLNHETFADEGGSPPPEWDALLTDITSLPTGRDAASNYERAIESFLTTMLYPALSNPEMQTNIHGGRKRIDITYSNVAQTGFFGWLAAHYSAPHVFVECKNYRGDPTNPELDQLSGRFSPNRGQFGLLVCRNIEDKELFAQRCRDTAQDQRGFIVYLDDNDLRLMVDRRQNDADPLAFTVLRERFNALIM